MISPCDIIHDTPRWANAMAAAALTLAMLVAPFRVSSAAAQICGDANGSGSVTLTDGVQVLRAAAGLSSPCTVSTCNVNDDASGITITDGVLVLRAAAGLSDPALHCPGGQPSTPIPTQTPGNPTAITSIELTCPDGPLTVGQSFSVPVVLRAADGVGVKSVSVRLQFSDDVEYVPPATAGQACSSGGFATCSGPVGSLTCACLSSGQLPDGVVVNVPFRLKTCPVDDGIRLDNPEAIDTGGQAVEAVAGAGCAIPCN